MKVEKRKDGGFILTAETEGDTPEQEFLDFIGNICDKVKKNLKSCIWVIEYYDGTNWVPTVLFGTRKEARDEVRKEKIGTCRVSKYARI